MIFKKREKMHKKCDEITPLSVVFSTLFYSHSFFLARAKRPGWKSKSKVKISIFQARWRRRRDECDIFLLELLSSQFCNLLLCSFISHLLAELHTRITLYTSRNSKLTVSCNNKDFFLITPSHVTMIMNSPRATTASQQDELRTLHTRELSRCIAHFSALLAMSM